MPPPPAAPLRRLRSVASALALALAAGRASAADDAAARVQAVIDALRTGDVPAAVTKLGGPEESDPLAARADLVHVLCDRAYRLDQSAETKTPDARRALADRLVSLATAAAAAAPADDRARWALAEALVVRERAGPRTGPDAWNRAADLLAQVHSRKPDDTLPLLYAVTFLLEGACLEEAAAVPLSERSEALARTAIERQKDSPTVAVSLASAQFWAARTLLASNKKVSREQTKATFDSLRRFATRDKPVLEAATLWNDAVAWARRSGYVLPERFVTSQHSTLDATLDLDVPVSSRWSFQSVVATEDQPGYDYVTEVTADGKRVRQVLFRRYVWGRPYTFEGPNSVGGDNVKSIAQGLQAMFAARVLAAGAKLEGPARKPFNRDFDGFVFEAKGRTIAATGSNPEPLRIAGYVMRGHDQASYAVLVYDWSDDDAPSPEIEALLASLRDPAR